MDELLLFKSSCNGLTFFGLKLLCLSGNTAFDGLTFKTSAYEMLTFKNLAHEGLTILYVSLVQIGTDWCLV